MPKKRVFVSFDYDHDLDLKNLLVGQALNPDSPFDITDNSLKETQPEADWLANAKRAINRSEVVVVVLGGRTHSASGVKKEVKVTNDLGKPKFQLKVQGSNPSRVEGAGVVYDWTWDNLKKLLA